MSFSVLEAAIGLQETALPSALEFSELYSKITGDGEVSVMTVPRFQREQSLVSTGPRWSVMTPSRNSSLRLTVTSGRCRRVQLVVPRG